MKRIISLLICTLFVASIAGCSNGSVKVSETVTSKETATETTVTTVETEETEPAVLYSNSKTGEDVFDTGFYGEQIEASGNLYFFKNGNASEWQVYILDEEFTDALRYLPQANAPDFTVPDKTTLNEEGNYITVNEGQWLYIYCSENAYTADNPIEGSLSWCIWAEDA